MTPATQPPVTHQGAVQEVWPQVARRLRAALLQRGASWHDTDDLVQECALRVLSHDVPFTDADDLLTWCLTVARHAHIDLHRGRARVATEAAPELLAAVNVHEEVVARLRLQSVLRVWPQLSAVDRQVLVHAVEEVPALESRREAVRLYVQRNRARQRLHALIAAVIGILGLVGRSARRQVLPLAAVSAAAVTVLTLALITVSPQGAQAVQGSFGVQEAPRVQPPPETSEHVVDQGRSRLVLSSPASAQRRPSAATPGGARRKASVRAVASAQGPGGYGAQVTSHDRPSTGGGLVCVGDLPVLPDTCVPDPTASTRFPGH